MQKVASIEIIHEISTAENSDNLEIAHVLGWRVVVRKGDYQKGDKIVYVEIDSEFIGEPEFASFLANKHWRVKSIKLRKNVSQGLILPLSILPEGSPTEIGSIVAPLIGARHYEKPDSGGLSSGSPSGSFPSYLGWSKTDESNAASYPELIVSLQGQPYYITEKADGSSGSAAYFNDEFIIASRNLQVKFSEEGLDRWSFVAKKYNLPTILKEDGKYAIQFEVVGPGIQKNRMGLKELEIRVFNIYNIQTLKYEGLESLKAFCQIHNLPMARLIEEGGAFNHDMEKLTSISNSLKYENGSEAEGIVVRPKQPLHSQAIQGRFSFKVLNSNFLIKNDE